MSSAFQTYATYRLRAFGRLVSAFHRECIPVLHFTDLDTEDSLLDPSLRLRRTFEAFKTELPSGPGDPFIISTCMSWLASVLHASSV